EVVEGRGGRGVGRGGVRGEARLPGFKAEVFGETLMILGAARGRMTYRVTLAASLPDSFGQTLGRDQAVTFDVTSAPTNLGAVGGPFVVLDPAAPPRFPVYSTNHPALTVRANAVTPEDWPAFQEYVRSVWGMRGGREGWRPEPPGRLVMTKTLPVPAGPDEPAETSIDLSPALAGGRGQVVVVVEPAEATAAPRQTTAAPPVARDVPRAQRVVAWVQATSI